MPNPPMIDACATNCERYPGLREELNRVKPIEISFQLSLITPHG